MSLHFNRLPLTALSNLRTKKLQFEVQRMEEGVPSARLWHTLR